MKWIRVDNGCRQQPKKGVYSEWKDRIAHDCGRQCVYCAISEAQYGGIDNFHVEHFKPKSRFKALTNIITNLYLACAICNRFKGNDWPGAPTKDHSTPSYPDPGKCDYNDLFEANTTDLQLTGKYVGARYVIERLFLNRPQLLRERRIVALESRISELFAALKGAVVDLAAIPADHENHALFVEMVTSIATIQEAAQQLKV